MNYLKLLCDLHSLKKNTSKSWEEIQILQRKKLRKMLKYAYKHSPYYSKRFAENGINDKNISTVPITGFPTTDKTDFIKHFDEIVTAADLKQEQLREFDENAALNKRAYKNKYHLVHSSGSTGKPSYFVYDNKAWDYMLIGMLRAALWNMSMSEILKYFFKTPRLLYIAATDGRYGGAMAIGDGIDNVGAKQLFLNVNTPLEEWVEQINRFKPDMIIGYPSALKILGELCERNEIHINAFRTISCGEPL
ncbi:MAG: phenylacetate--CoA ligase family protein, partial [Oscillospiraceae bacterium]|nr:phenylacetate--CoA ligase family protein [Oscillospiraceae bacterium]